MGDETVSATRFKSDCLKLLNEVNSGGKTIVVTRHGKPMAKLIPAANGERPSPFGLLKGTVLRYDDPFEPVAADDWDSGR